MDASSMPALEVDLGASYFPRDIGKIALGNLRLFQELDLVPNYINFFCNRCINYNECGETTIDSVRVAKINLYGFRGPYPPTV